MVFVIVLLRASARTESFTLEGVSIEHELVPIMTSVIGVYGEYLFNTALKSCDTGL